MSEINYCLEDVQCVVRLMSTTTVLRGRGDVGSKSVPVARADTRN